MFWVDKTNGSYEDEWYLFPAISFAVGKQRFKGFKAIYIHWLRYYIKIAISKSKQKL